MCLLYLKFFVHSCTTPKPCSFILVHSLHGSGVSCLYVFKSYKSLSQLFLNIFRTFNLRSTVMTPTPIGTSITTPSSRSSKHVATMKKEADDYDDDATTNRLLTKLESKHFNKWVGALVYWLWEETHVLKMVGLNPSTIYWMDIFCCKNCNVCLKRQK